MSEERLEDIEYSPNIWSVSALKCIGSCGKKFHYQYLQSEVRKVSTPNLEFGSAIHKCIELIHKGGVFEPRDFLTMWEETWYEYAKNTSWEGSKTSKSSYTNLGIKILSKYVDRYNSINILQSEFKFKMKFGEYWIQGIIDQIIRTPEGKLLVVDMKTGQRVEDSLLLRRDPQFTLYWYVTRELYGESPLLAWLHLRTGEMVYTERTEDDLIFVKDIIQEADQRVKLQMFSRNVDWTCNFCPFRQDCLGLHENKHSGSTKELP